MFLLSAFIYNYNGLISELKAVIVAVTTSVTLNTAQDWEQQLLLFFLFFLFRFHWTDLRGWTKGVTEVDTDHSSCLRVDHEVGQMSVSDAQNPVADAEQSVRAGEVRAQGEEGLRVVAHLQKRSPGN